MIAQEIEYLIETATIRHAVHAHCAVHVPAVHRMLAPTVTYRAGHHGGGRAVTTTIIATITTTATGGIGQEETYETGKEVEKGVTGDVESAPDLHLVVFLLAELLFKEGLQNPLRLNETTTIASKEAEHRNAGTGIETVISLPEIVTGIARETAYRCATVKETETAIFQPAPLRVLVPLLLVLALLVPLLPPPTPKETLFETNHETLSAISRLLAQVTAIETETGTGCTCETETTHDSTPTTQRPTAHAVHARRPNSTIARLCAHALRAVQCHQTAHSATVRVVLEIAGLAAGWEQPTALARLVEVSSRMKTSMGLTQRR